MRRCAAASEADLQALAAWWADADAVAKLAFWDDDARVKDRSGPPSARVEGEPSSARVERSRVESEDTSTSIESYLDERRGSRSDLGERQWTRSIA